jgi:hypothetical protein
MKVEVDLAELLKLYAKAEKLDATENAVKALTVSVANILDHVDLMDRELETLKLKVAECVNGQKIEKGKVNDLSAKVDQLKGWLDK